MICPFCKKESKDNSVFCGHCGKKIPRCPTCGMLINKPLRFCVNDGTPIPEEIILLFPIGTGEKKDSSENQSVNRSKRKFCINCGEPCTPGEKYCSDCASSFVQQSLDNTVSYCVECGKICNKDSLLCGDCTKKQRRERRHKRFLWLLLTMLCLGIICLTFICLHQAGKLPLALEEKILTLFPQEDRNDQDDLITEDSVAVIVPAGQDTEEYTADSEGTPKQAVNTPLSSPELTVHQHQWRDWFTEEQPSCTESGIEKRVCILDLTHTETRKIPALGHDWIPATYAEPETCSRCGIQRGEPLKPKPGPDDLYGQTGVTLPNNTWLSDYETKYVKTHYGLYAYLRWSPSEWGAEYGRYVNEGESVTVLAMEGGYSLVKTADGRAGWVTSDLLVNHY